MAKQVKYRLTRKGLKGYFTEATLKGLIRKSLLGDQRSGLTRARLESEVEKRNPTVQSIDSRDITRRLRQMIKEGRVERLYI